MKSMQSFVQAFAKSAERSKPHHTLVSVLGVVGFPVYYFMWTYVFAQPYENFWLRLACTLICLGFLLRNYWPKKLQSWQNLYFFGLLLVCVTFFFNYMMLMNQVSMVWLVSTAAAAFILVLIVEWKWFFSLYTLGATLAWGAYFFTNGALEILPTYLGFSSIFLFTGLAGTLCNRTEAKIHQQQLEKNMLALCNNIAHELRTPLLSVKGGIAGLQKYLPVLFEGYEIARHNNLVESNIRKSRYESLYDSLARMDSGVYFANSIIDMLLLNVNSLSNKTSSASLCSIDNVVDNALSQYPFDSAEKNIAIHWDKHHRFDFLGPELMVEHIIFNLIKNALFFIIKVNKGEIYIWYERQKDFNTLHFKDTGQGIPPETMSHIFEHFFTTTLTGTGIGLSFCKMVMKNLSGDIICTSQFGEYTEFVLKFPKNTQ